MRPATSSVSCAVGAAGLMATGMATATTAPGPVGGSAWPKRERRTAAAREPPNPGRPRARDAIPSRRHHLRRREGGASPGLAAGGAQLALLKSGSWEDRRAGAALPHRGTLWPGGLPCHRCGPREARVRSQRRWTAARRAVVSGSSQLCVAPGGSLPACPLCGHSSSMGDPCDSPGGDALHCEPDVILGQDCVRQGYLEHRQVVCSDGGHSQ